VSAPRDMLDSVKSAIISAQTAIAIKDATAGPERTTMDGYSGAYASKHVQYAIRELERARDLLIPVADASEREKVAT
jgi:hypothetical protein